MDLLCAKDVARVLGVSPRTAQRYLAAGLIPGFRLGAKLWRVPRVKLEEFVARELNSAAKGSASTGGPETAGHKKAA
jgi:excisionase family DNA binding protein